MLMYQLIIVYIQFGCLKPSSPSYVGLHLLVQSRWLHIKLLADAASKGPRKSRTMQQRRAKPLMARIVQTVGMGLGGVSKT
jgi:hypothetical protein